MRLRPIIEIIVTAAVGVMAVVVIWSHFRPNVPAPVRAESAPSALPSGPIRLGSAVKGSATAKVALIEFSDFECDYCSRFAHETMPAIEKRYVDPGLVVIGFRHFPNEQIHPHAVFAAQSASCAGAQGRFWEMHDALFGDKQILDRAGVRSAAAAIKVDQQAFGQCLVSEADGQVDDDIKDAVKLHVSGTPSFFVGLRNSDGTVSVTSRIAGARALSTFTDALDAALKK